MEVATSWDTECQAHDEECRSQEKVKLPSSHWGRKLAPHLKLCIIKDEVYMQLKIWCTGGHFCSLSQDMFNFCFISPLAEFIGVGLSIFMVSYPMTEVVMALHVALYDQKVENPITLAFASCSVLQAKGTNLHPFFQ
jgi:hypothetical protein